MDVIEKAKQLGEAIMQDDRCKRLQLARAANDADPALQKMIGEFNLRKMRLSNELHRENGGEKAKEYEESLKEIYAQIMQTPQMQEFEAAKKDMDELISHINSIIQVSVTGEAESSGCAGNCEGCRGCH